MTSADMESVKAGLASPFWKWLQRYLKEESTSTSVHGIQSTLTDVGSILEREQFFGASRKLLEVVDQVPHVIEEKIKQLKAQEDENTRSI